MAEEDAGSVDRKVGRVAVEGDVIDGGEAGEGVAEEGFEADEAGSGFVGDGVEEFVQTGIGGFQRDAAGGERTEDGEAGGAALQAKGGIETADRGRGDDDDAFAKGMEAVDGLAEESEGE